MIFTMPQIIKNMGFTSTRAQLLTAPPYATAALSSIGFAYLSDKFRWRMPFLVGSQLLTLIGFAVIYSHIEKLNENVGVAYFSLFLICA
ncbi:hypothetical protein LTR93_012300, partial [Exophiala xenobiotica]